MSEDPVQYESRSRSDVLAPIVAHELATIDRLIEIARRSHDPLVALEGYRSRLVEAIAPQEPAPPEIESKRATRGVARRLTLEAVRAHGTSTPADQLVEIIERMAAERKVSTNRLAIMRALGVVLGEVKQTAAGPLMRSA